MAVNTNTSLADTSIAKIKAEALVRAAVLLDQAKMDRKDKEAMAAALDNNLQLWVAIKTIIDQPDCVLPNAAKTNLTRLCKFVADQTFRYGIDITDDGIDVLGNINFRVAEGVLENIGEVAHAT